MRYDVVEAEGFLQPPDKKQDWRIIYFNVDDPNVLFVVWECWSDDN